MSFKQFNLDTRINTAVQRAGFKNPTPIQSSAIPPALAGRDLIGTAQTGTGKTAAFVLPILQKLLSVPLQGTRALIITPTRELAEQIHQTIQQLSYGTKIRSVSIYGGVGAAPQIKALQSGVEIIVACPGRLLDHFRNQQIKLDKVEILVLDEADRMLDMGFLPDIKRILGRLPKKRQTLLYSATFPQEIESLARQTLRNPKRVAVGVVRPAHTVDHTLFPVPHHLKNKLLMELLDQTDTQSVLIFTRTKHRAMNLLKKIKRTPYKATSLHGDRTQGQRRQALNGFREGRYQIMVATDIAARGLDIDGISHVINFDMPGTADAYIHRIGRTGRAQHTGEAYTFVTPDDLVLVKKIEKIMRMTLPRKTLPNFDYAIPRPEYPPKKNKSRNLSKAHRH
ncbi:MAG TPA: DEAD/DEAH box helicase [Chloroflexi bacterium]|nr:MAG: ATP-dependent helicase [Chloroflexota bacterium]HDD54871.1 DEAD/DEAH box helicase [Chloroflexota bacterium]